MKDMSEEKVIKRDVCECDVCRGKQWGEKPKEFKQNWVDVSEQSRRLVEKNEQIKSLESRLKEAREENKVWAEASKDWAVIWQRLSQAEAEKEDLEVKVKVRDKMLQEMEAGKKHDFKLICEGHENQINTREALEKRLSHLMDVAGKMAGAVEKIATIKESTYEIRKEINPVLAYKAMLNDSIRHAKLALAEWEKLK